MTTQTTLQPIGAARLDREVRVLARRIDGELIQFGHPAYDAARRVWNGSIDRRPAVIARCANVGDVVAALTFGRDAGIPIAVRGGGHSFPGLSVCDGGIVIDLSPMKAIRANPAARMVHAQPGVLLGELDRATQASGLAVPLGSVSHTGIAGLTLGGGFGWLMRHYGLTIDHVEAMDVVAADGRVLHASAAAEPELFWGLRGGGGNFGIVVDFEYRLQAVGPTVLAGILLWPLESAREVIGYYRAWAKEVPDALTTALILRRAPVVAGIPQSLHGRPVVGVACCWSGPVESGESVIEPLREHGPPLVDLVAARSFVDHQSFLDPSFPHGIWIHSKATDVEALTDGVVEALIAHAGRIRSPRSGIIAWQMGGAVARFDADGTPFGSRHSGYLVDILGATNGPDGFAAERRWAREGGDAIAAHATGVYVNWLMDEGERRVREAYGARRFARLQSIKRLYDPDNVFRLNQNIRPS
jgi:FAD/FMN-containing dehydrogenase